jgi:hypothetical protein
MLKIPTMQRRDPQPDWRRDVVDLIGVAAVLMAMTLVALL